MMNRGLDFRQKTIGSSPEPRLPFLAGGDIMSVSFLVSYWLKIDNLSHYEITRKIKFQRDDMPLSLKKLFYWTSERSLLH